MLMLLFPRAGVEGGGGTLLLRNPFTPYCRERIQAKMYPSSFF